MRTINLFFAVTLILLSGCQTAGVGITWGNGPYVRDQRPVQTTYVKDCGYEINIPELLRRAAGQIDNTAGSTRNGQPHGYETLVLSLRREARKLNKGLIPDDETYGLLEEAETVLLEMKSDEKLLHQLDCALS